MTMNLKKLMMLVTLWKYGVLSGLDLVVGGLAAGADGKWLACVIKAGAMAFKVA